MESSAELHTDDDFGTINNIDWFDTWLCAKGDNLKRLVETSIRSVGFHEEHTVGRLRKRQPASQRFFEAAVEMVVCNLAWNMSSVGAKGFIAYDRTKMKRKTRYAHPLYSVETVTKIIDWMTEYGAVTNTIGFQALASTMAPTDWFRSLAKQHAIAAEDIGRSKEEEVIYLTRNTKSFDWKDTYPERIEYRDTPETEAFRQDLRVLNTSLEAADIAFLDDGMGHVDVTARRLKRYFSIFKDQKPRFDQHGRLFGGFWINLKSYRRANIRVQGEPCADLDFSSMFLSLAYAEAGLSIPEGDLYDLSETLQGYVGSEHRDGVKAAFNSALFGYAVSRLPRGVRAWSEVAEREAKAEKEDVKWLPPKTTLGDLKGAFARKHPAIASVWGAERGFAYFMQESNIILKTLFRLMEANVTGLPCHDGLLVPQSKAGFAKVVMEESSLGGLGVRLKVKHKPFPPMPDPNPIN